MMIPKTEKDTPEFDERWEKDTAFMRDMLIREIQPRKGDLMLDYGCGIGRLAKEFCALGCNVIGVDISPEFRRYAVDYVNAPGSFMVFSPQEFDLLLSKGLKCDCACAIWSLQHSAAPVDDIIRINRALKVLAPVFVADNRNIRAIPVTVNGENKFAADNADIWNILNDTFGLKSTVNYPAGLGLEPEKQMIHAYIKTSDR